MRWNVSKYIIKKRLIVFTRRIYIKRWKKHQDLLKGESSRVMILFRKIRTGLWDLRIIVLYAVESVFFARVAARTIIRMAGIPVIPLSDK